jgi:arsenite methyltransferase
MKQQPEKLFKPENSERLDDPEREERQKPEEVIRNLNLKPGFQVADLGAGTGYFTFRLAKAVAPGGKVFAVDRQEKMLEIIRSKNREAGLKNIKLILSQPDDPLLPENSLDLVLLVGVYHELEKPEKILSKIKASLKPEGELAVIDLKKSAPFGPPRSIKKSALTVIKEIKACGFSLSRKLNFLAYQYFLVFKKA